MRHMGRKAAACALVCAAWLLLTPGRMAAQDDEGTPQTDPSARVARISVQYGNVSLQPAGETEWVAAVPNRPLTSGDSLWVDAGGRAELHVGSAAIRLGGSTGITLLEVSDRIVQIRLAEGSMILNARHVDDDDVLEADTPNLAFSVLAPGEYRIDVNPDGTETSTAVVRGQGRVTGGGRDYTVVAGQQARFSGLDELSYEISPVPQADNFDRWAEDRDRREDRATSASYVSREMTGYEDLDSNGQWSVVAAYGPVWTPVGVPVGWAPYRYGHWVWIQPWGWTWVDDQPWGFAPFHYGRWAFWGGRWVWIPGPVVIRPVYAPALVAFVGGGPGGGFALTVGGGPGVAWFPLGPGEVFVPAYRVSRVYVTQVNVTNTRVPVERVTTVYNSYRGPRGREVAEVTYANRGVPGGVTAVSRETFVRARPVGRNVVNVRGEEIERAPVWRGGAEVAPERASVMGAGAAATSAPPAAVQNRMVRSNRMPNTPAPYPQRLPAVNANEGQTGAAPGQPGRQPRSVERVEAPPAAAAPAQPAAPPTAGQPPARAPRTIERVEPPPPAPAAAPTQPAAAPPAAAQAPSRQNVQLNPPPKPKTQEETREEDRKYQRYQEQQQKQQKPSSGKNEKPREKEKDKPNKP